MGGVGYEVEAPMSTFYGLPSVGAEVTLHTHLVVREDAHVLFGFGTERERSLFREVIKVSGVGPRIALAILSGVSVDDFHRCVETGRCGRAGTRARHRAQDGGTAHDRDARPAQGPRRTGVRRRRGSAGRHRAASPQAEAFSALVALGYRPAEVTRLLQKIEPSVTSTEDMIRHALRAAAG